MNNSTIFRLNLIPIIISVFCLAGLVFCAHCTWTALQQVPDAAKNTVTSVENIITNRFQNL